jgi:hypothetical protein
METAHKADPIPDLGMWDLFVSHIQSNATIRDLIGEHKIAICSKYLCAYAMNGGVKRHVQHCKNGSAMEIPARMHPELVQGVRGDGQDERDLVNDDPEKLPELRPKMMAEEPNELGGV